MPYELGKTTSPVATRALLSTKCYVFFSGTTPCGIPWCNVYESRCLEVTFSISLCVLIVIKLSLTSWGYFRVYCRLNSPTKINWSWFYFPWFLFTFLRLYLILNYRSFSVKSGISIPLLTLLCKFCVGLNIVPFVKYCALIYYD